MCRTRSPRFTLMVLFCCLAAPGTSFSIDTPDTVSGSQAGPGIIEWQWSAVEDAVEYELTIDGAVAGTSNSLQWVSDGLWQGDHSLTVKAIDETGQRSEQSSTAKIYLQQGPTDPEFQISIIEADSEGNNGLIDPRSYDYPEVREKAGYKLVFSDEFNGNALNETRWHSQLRWDGEWNGERYEYRLINGEDQFYVNILSPDEEHQREVVPYVNPFEFDGNRLAIRAKLNPLKKRDGDLTYGKLLDIAEQQTFVSGVISTHEKFARKYGYFEARIKIPGHTGTFPAFWLFHENRAWEGTQRTEIDIMENLGHAPWYIYNSFHYFDNVSEFYGGDANFIKPKPSGQIYTGVDFSKDYHVYAVKWEPGKITWFIDGKQMSELENAQVNYEELYLMINLAMGGNWTNFPTSAGGLGRPTEQRYPTAEDIRTFTQPALEIDYVRVYEAL